MSARGKFFAVDLRVWAMLCEFCEFSSLNLAVAYLVLARGTLRDQRTTSWSVNSIEQRTGIPRLTAKAAIRALIDEDFLEHRRKSTRPQYYIRPFEITRRDRWAKD